MPAVNYTNLVGRASGSCWLPDLSSRPLRLLVFGVELVVLVRPSPGQRHRIALLVPPDLLPKRRDEVYVEAVGELQLVCEDVRDLLTNPLRPLRMRHDSSRFLRSEPLEEFDQLADLTGERHDEVLGGVKSLPVPLGGKL